MIHFQSGARAGLSSHRSYSRAHVSFSVPTSAISQSSTCSKAHLVGSNYRFARFRSSAAALEAEAAPVQAAKAKPVMDLPTSEESEELLRIRHSVRP
jgi:hypothetical protein